MSDFLDINYLRANCQMIHFFGLGFVQLKLNDRERMHFYHPSLEGFAEEPHDHRYNFISKVLKGSLRNDLWRLGQESRDVAAEEIEVRYESCKADVKKVPESWSGVRVYMGHTITSEGSSYHLDNNTFHQVQRVGDGPCITFLTREEPVKEFARILAEPGSENVCPFSRNLSDEQLWQIVEDCLNT